MKAIRICKDNLRLIQCDRRVKNVLKQYLKLSLYTNEDLYYIPDLDPTKFMPFSVVRELDLNQYFIHDTDYRYRNVGWFTAQSKEDLCMEYNGLYLIK